MFGVVRIFWAVCVMVSHLCYPNLIGNYAVYGFYVLSGYLMTLIMHQTYGFHTRGRIKFAMNRALRLYPMYWAAAVLTLILIHLIDPASVVKFNPDMYAPADVKSVFENALFIFPSWLSNTVKPRLVPQAWSLTVEMCFYVLICIGVSRTFVRTMVWFVLSLFYVGLTYYVHAPVDYRYYPIAAASLPFSIGGLLYFFSNNADIRSLYMRTKLSTNLLLAVMIINVIVWISLYQGSMAHMHVVSKLWRYGQLGFYINLLLCSGLIFSIIMGGRVAFIGARIDRFIGDLSYPIYLMHWGVGLLVSFLVFGAPLRGGSPQGILSLIISMVVITILSTALIYLLDRPIQTVRDKVKSHMEE
ncbi:MAG TPA: acyltransferase [Nitrospiria bacterium]|nr:acyltransferase [Nitrospiria bacterium]